LGTVPISYRRLSQFEGAILDSEAASILDSVAAIKLRPANVDERTNGDMNGAARTARATVDKQAVHQRQHPTRHRHAPAILVARITIHERDANECDVACAINTQVPILALAIDNGQLLAHDTFNLDSIDFQVAIAHCEYV